MFFLSLASIQSHKKLASSLAKEELTIFNAKFRPPLIWAIEGWKFNKIRNSFTFKMLHKTLICQIPLQKQHFLIVNTSSTIHCISS